MRFVASVAVVLLVVLACVRGSLADGGLNPDISVIGDVRAFVSDQQGSTDPHNGQLQLDLESVELSLQGNLNPYARADVFAAYTDAEGFVIEEAYATILRGLPAHLQLKAGQYRVDFGKLNLLHPHTYSFLDTPLVHQLYLGEEGLADVGLNLNSAIPAGNLVITPSVNLLKGDFAGSLLDEPGGEPADEVIPDGIIDTLATSERLSVFVPTGDYAGFEFGVNALQGALDDAREFDEAVFVPRRELTLFGVDVKYRSAPDRYRSTTIQAEWIRSSRDVLDVENLAAAPLEVDADGFFVFFDQRFRQRWNAGAIFERADSPVDSGLTYQRYGAFGGFSLMEESTLVRLLLRRTEDDAPGSEPIDEVALQLVFSLGPHRPHWF